MLMQVHRLAAEDIEETLKMAVRGLLRKPAALLQALMDHTHSSYVAALQAAASSLHSPCSDCIPNMLAEVQVPVGRRKH